jgi:DHA1 family tetracycline resistance protein-like MFS transporter
LLSNLVGVVDYLIMALAPNLAWLFAGRVLSGIATANITAASAYIADVSPPEKRAAAFGVLGSAFGLGFVIGPAIGGLAGHADPRLPFWLAAGVTLLNLLYGFFVLPESLPRERRATELVWQRANPFGSLKLLRSHRELFGLTAVMFLAYLAHEVYPNVWVLYSIAAYGWNSADIGFSLMLVGLCAAVSSAFFVGPFVARFGERRSLLIGLCIGAGATALFGTPSGVVFLVAIFISCLAMFGPQVQSLMTKRVGPSEQGELQGAIACVRGISMLIGPGVFTWTFAEFSGPLRGLHLLGAPWFLSGAMYFITLLIAWRVTSREDEVVDETPIGFPSVSVPEA